MSQKILPRKLTAIGTVSLIGALTLTATTRVVAQTSGAGANVPFQFQAGQPARADEVNQNFETLVSFVEELRVENDSLQDQVDALQAELASLAERARFMEVSNEELSGLARPHLILEGVSVHVRKHKFFSTGTKSNRSTSSG